MSEQFGLELRRIREERGIMVEELAEKSGISATIIRAAERGKLGETPVLSLQSRWDSHSTRSGDSRGGRDSVSVVLVVVFSSVISAVIGVLGLLVSERERRKGSAWWAWVLPGTFGVLLIVVGIVRLVWVI
jgi:DNA-binding XRE family transcriptional regulator